MADEFVYIRLKEHGSDVPPGRVTRRAFEEIWEAKGHVIVDTEEAERLGSPATMMEMQAGSAEPASSPDDGATATSGSTSSRKRG